ncbi:MAG: type III secretion system chaperone, partial [Puniceicoccales bacterium]|nr:type III secretion system chaperone [Puniceicoccales bacterium]
ILKLNLHGTSTGHGVIGIDVQTNKFVLSRLIPTKNLDEPLLLEAIGAFFSTVSQLREKLAQFLQTMVSDKDTAFEGPALSPNLNFVV